jgi:hypothetical protein
MMNKELDEALVRDFPLLYADRHGDMRATCMVWGFPGDGWEPLIRRLSEKLEPLIQAYINEYPDAPCPPRATQVKEKFAGLCFYMTTETAKMDKLIRDAEQESYHICEVCGAEGRVRGDLRWILTLCDEHYKETRG